MAAKQHYVSRFDQIPVGGVFTHARYRPGLYVKNTRSTSQPYRGAPEPEDVYELGRGFREENMAERPPYVPVPLPCCGHPQGAHEFGLCQVVLNDGPPQWGHPPVFCRCPDNDETEV